MTFLPDFRPLVWELVGASFSLSLSGSLPLPGLEAGGEPRGGEFLCGWCWNNLTQCSLDLGEFCGHFCGFSAAPVLGLPSSNLHCQAELLLCLAPHPASASASSGYHHSVLPPGASPAAGRHLWRSPSKPTQASVLIARSRLFPVVEGSPVFEPPLEEESAVTSLTWP